MPNDNKNLMTNMTDDEKDTAALHSLESLAASLSQLNIAHLRIITDIHGQKHVIQMGSIIHAYEENITLTQYEHPTVFVNLLDNRRHRYHLSGDEFIRQLGIQ